MRRTIVFISLIILWGGIVGVTTIRWRMPANGGPSEGSGDVVIINGTGYVLVDEGTGGNLVGENTVDEPPGPLLERPLRVVADGCDMLAPGLVANEGALASDTGLFADNRLSSSFRVVDGMDGVEAALALGGEVEDGADIAIVPLPTLVSSLERLRALEPRAFLVVGWSQGRDAIYAKEEDGLLDPPDDDEISLVGVPGETATFLSLFLLSESGIDLSEITFLEPDDDAAPDATFAAVVRGAPDAEGREDGRHNTVTTSDATTLIPLVAIAPAGFIENNNDAVVAWTKAWFAGVEQMRADVPGAARQIAAFEDTPEAVDVLEMLGQLDFSSPHDNAVAMGLSGRGAITVEFLFTAAWSIWREVGVLTSPTPAGAPLAANIISRLLMDNPELLDEVENSDHREADFSTETILYARFPRDDFEDYEDAFVASIGRLADVFEHSALRVSVRRARDSEVEELIGRAVERYGLDRSRIEIGSSSIRPGGLISVLRAP